MIVTTVRSRSTTVYDRLDAHFFTAPGVSASERVAVLEAAGVPTTTIGDVADVSDPPRFARSYAALSEPGLPYLRPYDIFEFLPIGADRLSLLRNIDLNRLVVNEGTILQTCSGRNLGPVTIADKTLSEFALSHDMIRIEISDEKMRLYVLAFLKTATGQALLRRGKSGSVIDHITVGDVRSVPVPLIPEKERLAITGKIQKAVEDSAEARERLREIVAAQTNELPAPTKPAPNRDGWTQRSSQIFDRMDAGYYEPLVVLAREQMSGGAGVGIGELATAHLPARYKRYYVEEGHGRPILSGRQLLQFEPINLRYVSDRSFRNPRDYELSEGSVVFGAVGRSEGRQGTPVLITAARAGWLASNDVMRLVPREGVRPGALWLAIATQQARLQINALSFGSVVDHMNPWDVEGVRVPVVSEALAIDAEQAWAQFADAGLALQDAVDALERSLHEV